MARMDRDTPEAPAERSAAMRKHTGQGRASVEYTLVRKWVKIPKKKLTPLMQQRILERKNKQLKALELRRASANYKEIGQALGISTSYARDLCLKAANDVVIDDAKEVIMMDLLRLDEFQMLATRALRQNGDLNQIERIMRIMRERRDILGLTTDSWKEQQAERAGSLTNNGIMVVTGTSENFVEAMMKAVGVNPNSPEAQKRLAAIRDQAEKEGSGEYALQAPRPNELLMAAADSALNRNEDNEIVDAVIVEEDI